MTKTDEQAMLPPFMGPEPADPDWTDEESVAAWIEQIRNRAFFRGARHDGISRSEAKALVAALAKQDRQAPPVGDDVERIAKVLDQDHQLSCCACEVPAADHAAKARKLAEIIAALRDTE